MSAEQPQMVNIDELVNSMSKSLVTASEMVRTLTGPDSPHVYVMPEMEVTISLTFTYEQGQVKGIIGRSRESQMQRVDSSLRFKIATVPRPVPEGTGVEPRLGFLPSPPTGQARAEGGL